MATKVQGSMIEGGRVINSYTPTITNGGISVSSILGKWYESGPMRTYIVNFTVSASGGASQVVSASLPSGHVIDPSFLNVAVTATTTSWTDAAYAANDSVGHGKLYRTGVAVLPITVVYKSTTDVAFTYTDSTLALAGGTVLSSGDHISLTFTVPIVGLTEAP